MIYCDTFVLISWFTANSFYITGLCKSSHVLPNIQDDFRGEKRKFHHKQVSRWNVEGNHANAGRSEKEQKQQRSVKNTRDVGRPEQEPHGHFVRYSKYLISQSRGSIQARRRGEDDPEFKLSSRYQWLTDAWLLVGVFHKSRADWTSRASPECLGKRARTRVAPAVTAWLLISARAGLWQWIPARRIVGEYVWSAFKQNSDSIVFSQIARTKFIFSLRSASNFHGPHFWCLCADRSDS